MRNALQEKVQDKLKNKGKQRMRPKMGKMEIDYAMMQDAFFKKQQKPPMTRLGDLYYEGAPPPLHQPIRCLRLAFLPLLRARAVARHELKSSFHMGYITRYV